MCDEGKDVEMREGEEREDEDEEVVSRREAGGEGT